MEIDAMIKEAYKKKSIYVSTPKNPCEIILFDFEKPLKKIRYNDTEYVFYECQFIKNGGEEFPKGKYSIQLSFKTAWFQLYHHLKKLDMLKEKNIHLWIAKKNNRHWIYNTEQEIENTKHLIVNREL